MRPLYIRNVVSSTQWSSRAIGASKSSLSIHTPAYRNISSSRTASLSVACWKVYELSPETRQLLTSARLCYISSDTLLRTSLPHSRLFSQLSSLSQQRQDQASSPSEPQPDNTTEKPAESKGQESAEGEAGGKKSEEGEPASEKKDKDKSEKEKDKPPPPPHGDKTPWQVFTETLKAEFQASKEWNESTKQLSAGVNDFTQNPRVQKARTTYNQVTDAATTKTAEALKTTGKAIGTGAAWTWDTAPVKGVRKVAGATGQGLEYVTRPVRQSKAFKAVKDTVDDGSSSRYGGWIEKEERRRRRELRELNELQRIGGKPLEPMEEDPNAGTNVTLHKDSRYKEVWRDFKENSTIARQFSTMKDVYNESENPLISTARSISDRITGFFAENETAMVIKKFREMDPTFQLEPFLTEMREYILPEVLDAYVKGDIETLKLWLSAAQYQVYAALMQQYTTAGLKSDGKIVDIRNVDILNARLVEPGEIPVFIITCRTQEVHTYKNAKTGQLAAGMDDKVQQVTYAIGVTRIPEDVSNPETRGWRFIELQKSARDYY